MGATPNREKGDRGRRFRGILGGTLAVLLVLGLLPAGNPTARAASEADLKRKIQNLDTELRAKEGEKSQAQKDLDQLREDKERLKQEISALDSQIAETNARVENLKAKIEENTKKKEEREAALKAATERLETHKEELQKRLYRLYVQGDMTYGEVLFGARDFADFVGRVEILTAAVEADKRLLVEYKRAKDEVERQKRALESLIASLETDRRALQEELSRLALRKEEHTAKLSTYEDTERQIAQKLGEIDAELARIAAERSRASAELERIIQERRAQEAQRAREAQLGIPEGIFAWPVPGYYAISSPYAWRTHPIFGTRQFHNGIDIPAPKRTPIVAADTGVVTYARWMSGFGNTVIIAHGNGVSTLYGHIDDGGILVSEGQTVSRGERIALVGTTGYSTGPHLHFSVIVNGNYVPPCNYVRCP
ncbi:MAG: peptidoglycan DD-metalloendopeptidase family protein [Brockia lithotrophica]|nr:peptidoglycan DD-metalloendopeptidase family protein [Brockia lithotrophica]